MKQHKEVFSKYKNLKIAPNEHEKKLFARGEKYIKKIANISGIEGIFICNSLSMYGTHDGSDIDLFIITKPHFLWWVRVRTTWIFWREGVWRHGQDIRANFCLSFFITTRAMDLSKIALQDDIYLYYWIYFLKPIIDTNNIYERFLAKNSWVEIDENQKKENLKYRISTPNTKENTFKNIFIIIINYILLAFLFPKTYLSYWQQGKPSGIILSQDILKFHSDDQREMVRDGVLGK